MDEWLLIFENEPVFQSAEFSGDSVYVPDINAYFSVDIETNSAQTKALKSRVTYQRISITSNNSLEKDIASAEKSLDLINLNKHVRCILKRKALKTSDSSIISNISSENLASSNEFNIQNGDFGFLLLQSNSTNERKRKTLLIDDAFKDDFYIAIFGGDHQGLLIVPESDNFPKKKSLCMLDMIKSDNLFGTFSDELKGKECYIQLLKSSNNKHYNLKNDSIPSIETMFSGFTKAFDADKNGALKIIISKLKSYGIMDYCIYPTLIPKPQEQKKIKVENPIPSNKNGQYSYAKSCAAKITKELQQQLFNDKVELENKVKNNSYSNQNLESDIQILENEIKQIKEKHNRDLASLQAKITAKKESLIKIIIDKEIKSKEKERDNLNEQLLQEQNKFEQKNQADIDAKRAEVKQINDQINEIELSFKEIKEPIDFLLDHLDDEISALNSINSLDKNIKNSDIGQLKRNYLSSSSHNDINAFFTNIENAQVDAVDTAFELNIYKGELFK